MGSKYNRNYTIRHERVVNKLMEMAARCDRACFPISKIATELGMDQRTVRGHLKIIEVDNAGVFLDPDEKVFCTREGIAILAKRLGLEQTAYEPKS